MLNQITSQSAMLVLIPLTLLHLASQGETARGKTPEWTGVLSTASSEHTSDTMHDNVSSHQQLKDDRNTTLKDQSKRSVFSTQQTTATYRSQNDCGWGSLTLGAKCYKMVAVSEPVRILSWHQSGLLCSQHGDRLFNLKHTSDLKKLREWGSGKYSFIGVHAAKFLPDVPYMYHQSWLWNDGRVAHTIHREQYIGQDESCTAVYFDYADYKNPDPRTLLVVAPCFFPTYIHSDFVIMCETFTHDGRFVGPTMETKIQIQNVETSLLFRRYVRCPAEHFTLSFLACDVRTSCWAHEQSTGIQCDYPVTPHPPFFVCTNRMGRVPYSLVCDHRKDCQDGSDESFCRFEPCRQLQEHECTNHQCVPLDKRCDRVIHCIDHSDEERCELAEPHGVGIEYLSLAILGPQVHVTMNPLGFLNPSTVDANFSCPHTDFWCPDNTFCLPVYLRCNGVADCPGSEDEAGCDSYTCPGYYRCRGLAACLPVTLLCDGLYQCPQWDDELLCGFTCPHHCTCYGNAFFCHDTFLAGNVLQLRFLNGRNSNLTTADLVNNTMLVHLSLRNCNLKNLNTLNLPNLLFSDLSNNAIKQIKSENITGLISLRTLVLASNPVCGRFITSSKKVALGSIKILDLSNTHGKDFNTEMLTFFPSLTSLNLSYSGVESILGGGFQSLSQLEVLDLRGCPMIQFPRELFQGLEVLQEVHADNYKLCCPAMLPKGFNTAHCTAPEDEVSSCETLLRSSVYRVFLSVFAVCTLLGNMISIMYRLCINKATSTGSFSIFVTHLCVGDFLMGIYLAIIGIADHIFKGSYLWKDLLWTTSAGCMSAGFLSMLSSEISVCFIGLITLDRFIVIHFPFTTHRFRSRSAQMASSVVWLTGLLLAAVPLFPAMSYWNFYSQTGICIPLPITRKTFPGQSYSFGVMIVLNFALFLMIGSGQGLIYKSIVESRMTNSDTTKMSKDVTIARRLLTVVMSDFMCWFPIGLLGLLAANDIPVPGELNVAVAIFVLPINSALNPFLYTINTLMEKSQQRTEERLQQQLMAEFNDLEIKAG